MSLKILVKGTDMNIEINADILPEDVEGENYTVWFW
jgi:hypothetical protein